MTDVKTFYFSGVFPGGKKHYIYKATTTIDYIYSLQSKVISDMTTAKGYKYTNDFKILYVAQSLNELVDRDKSLEALSESEIKMVLSKEFYPESITYVDSSTTMGAINNSVVQNKKDATKIVASPNHLDSLKNLSVGEIPNSSWENSATSPITWSNTSIPVSYQKFLATGDTATLAPIGSIENKDIKKENNRNMDVNSFFNQKDFHFGAVKADNLAYSPFGLAVINSEGRALAYSNGEINDVTGMTFKSFPIFEMPIAHSQVAKGDMITHNGKFLFVTEVVDSGVEAVDVAEGEDKSVHLTKNMFGFNFVTKVFDMFKMMGVDMSPNPTNPFGNPMVLAMMMNGQSGGANESMSFMTAMMMASMAKGGQVNSNFNGMMLPLLMTMGKSNDSKNFSMSDMLMMSMMSGQFGNFFPAATAVTPSNKVDNIPDMNTVNSAIPTAY